MSENPFIVYGYGGPGLFCNRVKETKRLISAAENDRNVLMTSLRRLGKTSLIFHTFQILSAKKSFRTIYVDLQYTQSLNDLVKVLASSVSQGLYPKFTRALNEFMKIFRSVKPGLVFDLKTGNPSVQITTNTPDDANTTLEDLFRHILEVSKKHNVIIAFDEFQQIVNYPEKNIEALLRSYIQQMHGVNFLFSGSSTRILTEMFLSTKKPFYSSVEFLNLEKIETGVFVDFIKLKFKGGGVTISDVEAELILKKCRGITFNVQLLCNRLYSLNVKKITEKEVNLTIQNILGEYEKSYSNYKNLLTEFQWKLAKSIAKSGKVSKPLSGKFISGNNLGSVSSVSTALKALVQKEIIYKEKDNYIIQDVFFGLWLASNND